MTDKHEQKKYQQGYTYVIGCDEVGRGSLAGPVLAAAVILPLQALNSNSETLKWEQIKDSKLLTPKKREELSKIIKQNCVAWGIGIVEPKIIDKINIHKATLLAMRKAVEKLLTSLNHVIPEATSATEGYPESTPGSRIDPPVGGRDDTNKFFLFIDGKFTIPKFNRVNMEQKAVVAGDNKILSVAAASIVAKVYRDDLMRKLSAQYACYKFAQHKGYGTLYHRKMIIKHGLSDIHRTSFCKNLMVQIKQKNS